MMVNFTTTEVRMFRRAYSYRIGEQAADTANLFPVLPVYRQIALMQAMTNKTGGFGCCSTTPPIGATTRRTPIC